MIAAFLFGFCLGGLFGSLFATHPLWRDAFLEKVRGLFKKPEPAPVVTAKPFVMNSPAAADPQVQSVAATLWWMQPPTNGGQK